MESEAGAQSFLPGYRTPFVARRRELDALDAAWDRARFGQKQLVFLSGEPGIGKTRLATQLANAVQAGDGHVLFGTCDEEPLIAYQPFVEVLRRLISITTDEALAQQLGPSAGDLLCLVPDLAQRLPELERAKVADPESERYRLFQSIAIFLSAASKDKPILLVIEDLHWADKAILQLLRHIIRYEWPARIFILCTYRDSELASSHPLTEALADLRHNGVLQRIPLSGLNEEETKQLIVARTGHEPTLTFVYILHAQTEGNPFFAEEVLQHLSETSRAGHDLAWLRRSDIEALGIPEGVREVIRRRLRRLSEDTNLFLSNAAVSGRSFDFAVVCHMAQLDEEIGLACLDEALASHLVVDQGDRSGRRYAFAHALVRQTLYEELSVLRRQRMHLVAAQATEAIYSGDLGPHVAALAVNYRSAGLAADRNKALDYSMQAADSATAACAFEEAMGHLEAALDLIPRDEASALARAALLQRLGALTRATRLQLPEGTAYLEEALQIYETNGAPGRVAETHVALGLQWSLMGHVDTSRALSHFRAAEAMQDELSDVSQGALYAGLARNAMSALRTEEGVAAASRARSLAERLDDTTLWIRATSLLGVLLLMRGQVAEGFALKESAWRLLSEELPGSGEHSAYGILGAKLNLRDPAGILEWWREHQETVPSWARPRCLEAVSWAQVAAGDLGDVNGRQGRLVGPAAAAAEAALSLWSGDWEAVKTSYGAFLEHTQHGSNRIEQLGPLFLIALVHLAEGHVTEAEALLISCLGLATEGPYVAMELACRSRLAMNCAEMGRLPEAWAHLNRNQEILAGGEEWFGHTGDFALAKAVVAASEHRMVDAEESFVEAIKIFRRHRLLWDEAEALRLWGRAYGMTRRQKHRAIEKLDESQAIYESHGAGDAWIQRVQVDRHRLTKAGVQAPRYPDNLSPREFEVLQLLAQAKTNQQIADELLVSLSTVVSHVSNIFAKAGLSNRTEAASYAREKFGS